MSRIRTAVLVVAVLLIALNLRPAVVAVSPLLAQIRADLGIGERRRRPHHDAAGAVLRAARAVRRTARPPDRPRDRPARDAAGADRGHPRAARPLPRDPAGGLHARRDRDRDRQHAHARRRQAGLPAPHRSDDRRVLDDDLRRRCRRRRRDGAPRARDRAGLAAVAGAVGGLAVAAIPLWVPWVARARRRAAAAPPSAPAVPVRGLWRSPLAWQVTLVMGLQSLQFYALTAWAPTLFVDEGRSPTAAGLLLSLAGVCSLLTSAITPVLAARSRTQHHLVAAADRALGGRLRRAAARARGARAAVDGADRSRAGRRDQPRADADHPALPRRRAHLRALRDGAGRRLRARRGRPAGAGRDPRRHRQLDRPGHHAARPAGPARGGRGRRGAGPSCAGRPPSDSNGTFLQPDVRTAPPTTTGPPPGRRRHVPGGVRTAPLATGCGAP